MKLIENRKREKIIFEAFIKKYSIEFDSFEQKESPDFLVEFEGKTLGVEITELYSQKKINGLLPRGREKERQSIVERALKKAIDDNLPPLNVQVIMSDSIPKGRSKFLSEYLYRKVKKYKPNYGESVSLHDFLVLPEEFHCISIRNYECFKNPYWFCSETAFVREDFYDEIKARIDEKEKKLNEYLKKCDECWLIIAALGISGSSSYEYGPKMNSYVFQTNYPKVFFVEGFSLTFNRLNTINF